MKKIITALSLCFASSIAVAAGPLDGIYSCETPVYGSIYHLFITINGHADGASIFAVAAVTPPNDDFNFYGYGIGTATQTKFTGFTDAGYPFSVSYNPNTGTSSGTIPAIRDGYLVNAQFTCTKIW